MPEIDKIILDEKSLVVVLDKGIHLFDFLFFLLGEVVDVAYRRSGHAETHNSYAILLTFSSGAVGSLLIFDQQLMVQHNERVGISGNGQFVIAENLNHLAQNLPDGEIIVWKPDLSIPNDKNSTFFLGSFIL